MKTGHSPSMFKRQATTHAKTVFPLTVLWLAVASTVVISLSVTTGSAIGASTNGGQTYRWTSSDPYERAADDLRSDLATLEKKIRAAIPSTDPDDDEDLQDALSRYLLTHRQLSDNTRDHRISPPDLAELRSACENLKDIEINDEAKIVREEIQNVSNELQEAAAADKILTVKIKGNLLLSLTAASIDVLSQFAAIPGGAMSRGAAQFASLINQLGSTWVPAILSSPDRDPAANNALNTKNELIRKIYTDHAAEIDARVSDWIWETYFTKKQNNTPLSSWAEYGELLLNRPDKRAALQRRFLVEIKLYIKTNIIPHRQELLKNLGAQLRLVNSTTDDPVQRQRSSNLERYRSICQKILSLPPWTLQPASPAGMVSFGRTNYLAKEGDRQVVVEILRLGGQAGAVSVMLWTSDSTAHAGSDYSSYSQHLQWNDGQDGAQTVTIPILDDSESEPSEEFHLLLGKPQGGIAIGSPDTATVTIEDNDELPESRVPSPLGPPARHEATCKYLKIVPAEVELRPGQTADFRAYAVFSDNQQTEVTRDASWEPGPANSFTAPADFNFSAQVDIISRWQGCLGKAKAHLRPLSYSPPISHAEQRGLTGQPMPPDSGSWYAFCQKSDGRITYGEYYDPITQFIMAEGLPGPRNAAAWIDSNCPSWRCAPDTGVCANGPRYADSGREGYYALCSKETGRVAIAKQYNPVEHHIMAGPFVGIDDVNLWLDTRCPGRQCTPSGSCAAGPQMSPDATRGWHVLCNRATRSVVISEDADPVRYIAMAGAFRSRLDADSWTSANCPSLTCDTQGACVRTTSAWGLESGAVEVSPVDPWGLDTGTVDVAVVDQVEHNRRGSRSATGLEGQWCYSMFLDQKDLDRPEDLCRIEFSVKDDSFLGTIVPGTCGADRVGKLLIKPPLREGDTVLKLYAAGTNRYEGQGLAFDGWKSASVEIQGDRARLKRWDNISIDNRHLFRCDDVNQPGSGAQRMQAGTAAGPVVNPDRANVVQWSGTLDREALAQAIAKYNRKADSKLLGYSASPVTLSVHPDGRVELVGSPSCSVTTEIYTTGKKDRGVTTTTTTYGLPELPKVSGESFNLQVTVDRKVRYDSGYKQDSTNTYIKSAKLTTANNGMERLLYMYNGQDAVPIVPWHLFPVIGK